MTANKKIIISIIIKTQLTTMVAFISNLTNPIDDKVIVTVLYYTYCKKNYYTVNNC